MTSLASMTGLSRSTGKYPNRFAVFSRWIRRARAAHGAPGFRTSASGVGRSAPNLCRSGGRRPVRPAGRCADSPEGRARGCGRLGPVRPAVRSVRPAVRCRPTHGFGRRSDATDSPPALARADEVVDFSPIRHSSAQLTRAGVVDPRGSSRGMGPSSAAGGQRWPVSGRPTRAQGPAGSSGRRRRSARRPCRRRNPRTRTGRPADRPPTRSRRASGPPARTVRTPPSRP